MALGEVIVDSRSGQEFTVVWDAAAERRGETFHLTQSVATRAQPELQPRDPQQRPLRSTGPRIT